MRTKEEFGEPRGSFVTQNNLIESSVYFAVRKVIPATWLNDRDQFLYPNETWKTDVEFQNDCLCYTLFNNNIRSFSDTDIPNHWIPFTEEEVGAKTKFESNFMTDFMAGKISSTPSDEQDELFNENKSTEQAPLSFSAEAKAVFDAGKKLWQYYHKQPDSIRWVNASFYDIREYFQGRDINGRMLSKSHDEHYNELLGDLRATLKVLAKKIEPKIYEHGFLKE